MTSGTIGNREGLHTRRGGSPYPPRRSARIATGAAGTETRRAPRSGFKRRVTCIGTLLLALAALPSCAPQAVRVEPPAEVPEAFSASGGGPVPDAWWTALDDAALDRLVEEALRGNFTIRQAWDRLDQARALAEQAGAPLLPALDGTAEAARSVRETTVMPRTYTTEVAFGLAASYEVDLWGRVRSTADAARLDAYASAADLQSAAVTLAAQVAATWYQLVEAYGQLRLLSEQIETNEKYLDLIQVRFGQGLVQASDVLQQKQLVEETRGQRVRVESAVEVLRHQLAVLVGRPPRALEAAVPEALPALPPLPPTGLPAALVRRRPDVRAAELRVQAADRRVAAAVADQFPRLSLTVSAETSAERVRDLFDNWMANVAANVVAPLFDANRRGAEVDRTRALVSERLNAYGGRVLVSLQEVEDALVQEAEQARFVQSLAEQLRLAREATNRVRDVYSTTGTDFLRYLTTLLGYQRLQRTYLSAERDLVLFRIDLYRALAGGWALPRPARATVGGPREPVAEPAVERNASGRAPDDGGPDDD
ncbi:MAG: TolC family protein [Phycisphaerae bacterium]